MLIATVATEADDPSRWSHVFLCAIINGRVMPLDTSHGPAPGWMVPKHRIHRWQTWTLDGKPADVKIPSYQGLHGYSATARRGIGAVNVGGRRIMLPRIVKRNRGFGGGRGLGDEVCTTDDNGDEYCYDDGSGGTNASSSVPFTNTDTGTPASGAVAASSGCPAGYSLDGWVCAPNPGTVLGTGSGQPTNTPATSVSPNYAALVSSIANAASSDLKAVIQQPQALLNAQTWANLTAYLPIIGIAVLGVIVLSEVAGKK